MATSSRPSRTRALVYIVLASVLWSTGGVLIKSVQWHPIAIAGLRSGIAGLLILLYCRKRLTRKPSNPILIGALCYMATVILFVSANKMTTAANAILLQYTAPIWVAMFSGFLLKESVKRRDWATIAVVFYGMGLFFMESLSPGAFLGNILSVISGVFLAAVVICSRLDKEGEPVLLALYGNMLTFIVSLPWIIKHLPELSTQSFLGLLVLGIFQLGLSYIFFSESLKTLSALEGILIPVVEPLLNPIWVFFFFGEKMSFTAMLGGMVVIVAVTVNGLSKAKQTAID